MKYTSILIAFLSMLGLAACNSKDVTPSNTQNSVSIIGLTNFIENYYQQEFRQYNKEISRTFSTISITYKGKVAESDSINIPLITINIPKLNSETGIYKGDMNQDKKLDIIIVVQTQGGGNGGNVASEDYFTFTKEDDKNYRFNSLTNMNELHGCENEQGYFTAKEIKNNILLGTSSCFTPGDANCCPSLHYNTEVILKGNKLVLKNRTESNESIIHN